jgi:hypothetical protein
VVVAVVGRGDVLSVVGQDVGCEVRCGKLREWEEDNEGRRERGRGRIASAQSE